MYDIIAYLLHYIQVQNNIILYLLFCLGAIKASKQPDDPVDKPYRKLKVDDMPIFDSVVHLIYISMITMVVRARLSVMSVILFLIEKLTSLNL